MRWLVIVLVTLVGAGVAAPAPAQAVFKAQGVRAIEGSIAWSVGPFSNGIETHVAGSLDGRWDIGFGYNRFAADFGGEDDTTLNEWTPFARYFLYKEADDDAPVSLAVHAALFLDDYESSAEGWYALAGGQLFKRFGLANTVAIYPSVGFSLAAESFAFGDSDRERALYLTRQLGVHTLVSVGTDAWLRISAEEHAFRRETFRAVRAAYIRRF
jgi:hypothetical protein